MRSQWEPTGDQRTEPKKYIPLTMRRPDLDDLPRIPILPEGYILRAYQEGDAPSLAATLCSAFDTADWTLEKVYRELIHHPNVKATFVIAFDRGVVATASALLSPEDPHGPAILHWVGVDKGHRGKALGYIVSLQVLHYFKGAGYKSVILHTDDSRIAAIKTYLKLGFVPEHTNQEYIEYWKELLTQLGVDYGHIGAE